jgi:hypothetical protein
MERANSLKVEIDENNLYLIVGGITYTYKISAISERLTKATIEEKKNFTISPSGYGIHWASLDEDLSIQALVKNQTLNNMGIV